MQVDFDWTNWILNDLFLFVSVCAFHTEDSAGKNANHVPSQNHEYLYKKIRPGAHVLYYGIHEYQLYI